MTNPVLKRVSEESRGTRGFASFSRGTENDTLQADNYGNTEIEPSSVATLDGVISKTAGLAMIAAIGAFLGWRNGAMTGLLLPAILVAFVLSLVTMFKPFTAKITAPLYAIVEGFALGMISVWANAAYPGVARDALGISAAVFGVLLLAYSKRWVTVTAKMRSSVMIATFGIMVYYLVNLGVSLLFGTSLPLVRSNSVYGIGFSLLVAGIAAWNFLLDFDTIEKSVKSRADSRYEWALSFGVIVTFAWLYLEVLRLLSKLRSR
jgi:uncharacterized YccA/Bax inhibitor family protein